MLSVCLLFLWMEPRQLSFPAALDLLSLFVLVSFSVSLRLATPLPLESDVVSLSGFSQ